MSWYMLTFILYVFVASSTTVLLGKVLYENGAVFLERIFAANVEIVKPLNRILLIGFYLVNLGFVMAYISQRFEVTNMLQCIEFLGTRIGMVYLILGSMHLFNMILFSVLEKKINSKEITQNI